ncbi:MAG: hypothetical protein M0D55_12585 [Elusimicrobiota bacterium]|nr:MAG: hypothetical protein M0D55_12585 [Elusimicrobiota bacterium]
MLIRTLLLSAPIWSSAQPIPPRVELQFLGERKLSALPVGAVGVGNCFSPIVLREMTEVAALTISVNGPWERSAEHMAKQKAAEAGANCLQPLANYGPEEDHYPVVRQYRAFLVTTSVTTIDGTFRFPASPKTFEPAPQPLPALAAPAAAAPPAKLSAAEETAELLLAPPPEGAEAPWVAGPHITSHEIVLDLGAIDPRLWRDVRKDVKKYFPAPAFEALEKAKGAGRTVSIDLRRKSVHPLDEP